MDLPTPLLVTGVPRSGTTWLARTLAAGPRTAMPGREPMNPRGRQFALGGTVDGWVRLQHPEPRQARLLRRVYRGLEPRTLSRYGIRQLTAAAPWTRTIVKDPFAMLSIPTVVRVTGARPLLLYRNPSAVLASYRRMGWRADLDEVLALGARAPTATDADLAEASAMAVFWCFLNNAALDDIAELPQATVVSHESLIHGDHAALAQLRTHLGLRPATAERNEPAPMPQTPSGLHRFGRGRDEVLHGWRPLLSPAETAHMELWTADTLDRLERARLRLSPELPSDSTRGTR